MHHGLRGMDAPVHFFGCLPLLLVPSTCPYSTTTGSLFPSILVTCPNNVSLFSDFVYQCDLLSQILSGNLVSYPVEICGYSIFATWPVPVAQDRYRQWRS